MLQSWSRVATPKLLEPISPSTLQNLLQDGLAPCVVALSPSRRHDPSLRSLIERLEHQDPRQVQTISLIKLFERQQERLPPTLLSESTFSYDEIPWAAPFSVQTQLKRLADLFVAVVLLLLTAPFVGLSAMLIWLEDQDPFSIASSGAVGWAGRSRCVNSGRCVRTTKVARLSGLSQVISG